MSRAQSSTRSYTTRTSTDGVSVSSSSSHVPESYPPKEPDLTLQKWQDIAESMGIKPFVAVHVTDESRKLAHKVTKRRKIESKHMKEIIWNAIAPLAARHPKLNVTPDSLFNREPIPNYAPRLESTANRRIGMLPSRPAVTAGYMPQTFTSHQRDLQHGLISDVDGAPRDLSRLSHVCKDTYWPCFVIEHHETSMHAACNFAIEGTATCNNALMTLASALLDPLAATPDERLVHLVNRSIASFAIAVYKKTSKLIVHYSEGFVAEGVGVVQTFNLESESDVAALLARIESIFEWAEKVRLRAVADLLDVLDRRVNFSECYKAQDTASKGPMDVPGVGRVAPAAISEKKGGLIKAVIGSSMPSWSRVEM
jgi:hypothetical protein